MPRTRKRGVTRRTFIRSGTAALAVTGLGLIPEPSRGATLKPSQALVNQVMQAAAAGITEINLVLRNAAAEFKQMEGTRLPPKHLEEAECAKTLSIINAVILVAVAIVVAVVTFGAGQSLASLSVGEARRRIDGILVDLEKLKAALKTQRKWTDTLEAAYVRFRELSAEVLQAAVARDIFFHISQDAAHTARLLEAALGGDGTTLQSLLNRDASGSQVVIRQLRADPQAFTLTVSTGTLVQCISVVAQCSGKTFTVSR